MPCAACKADALPAELTPRRAKGSGTPPGARAGAAGPDGGMLRRALQPLFVPGALDDPSRSPKRMRASRAVLVPELRDPLLELVVLGREPASWPRRAVPELGAPLAGALDLGS